MVAGIGSENISGTTRRRGSGFGTILSTFGIRQASNLNSESSVNTHSTEVGNEISIPIDINESNIVVNGTTTINTNGTVNNIAAVRQSAPVNIMGTTPFDASEQPSRLSTSLVNDGSQINENPLPINLVLGQIESSTNSNNNDQMLLNSPPGPNTAVQGINLKNVHHFIYPAVRPDSAQLIHLDFPSDGVVPEDADEETVRLRKDKNGLFTLRLTPFIDNSTAANPGFYFDPILRSAGPGSQLVIGRYTEKVREAISTIPEPFHPAVFKSKVVSRTHGVFKVDDQGNWFVKDVKSSSGTFLNHQRLSQAATMSKDHLLKDGDILQLGLDFRGGTEEIYRCVKMRVELNKSWKRRVNAFNKEAIQKLKELQKMATGAEFEDCSICLSKIQPCQAVFISPCSHSWHYQCVRRLVSNAYPQFVCPNCRSVCDLEASLDSDDEEEPEVDDDLYLPNQQNDDRPILSPMNSGTNSYLPYSCLLYTSRCV